jgi:hypothetical protein
MRLGLGDLGGAHPLGGIGAAPDRRLVTGAGRQLEPHVGLDLIRGDAEAFGAHAAQVVLRIDVARLGREAEQTQGENVVLGHALAERVPAPQTELGLGVSLLCQGLPLLARRLNVAAVERGATALEIGHGGHRQQGEGSEKQDSCRCGMTPR